MQVTTPSKAPFLAALAKASQILGRHPSGVIIDEWNNYGRRSYAIGDFDMRREGRKQYAFYRRDGSACALQRYSCSHIEAKRRFALYLITRRLTS